MIALALWVAGCEPPPAKSPAELLTDLSSSDPTVRAQGARGMRAPNGAVDPQAVPHLLMALEKERSEMVQCEILVTLGESGTDPARTAIEARINAPSNQLKRCSRRAFKKLLVRRGQWDDRQELPLPPHPVYGPNLLPSPPAGSGG